MRFEADASMPVTSPNRRMSTAKLLGSLTANKAERRQMFAVKLQRVPAGTGDNRLVGQDHARNQDRIGVFFVAGIDRMGPATAFDRTFALNLPKRAAAGDPADLGLGAGSDQGLRYRKDLEISRAKEVDWPHACTKILGCAEGAECALRGKRDRLAARGAGKAKDEVSSGRL